MLSIKKFDVSLRTVYAQAKELATAQGAVPLGRFVPFLDCLCEVVHSAHEKGIVHRDIKPHNVMVLSRGGRFLPKLLDLGVAKLLEDVGAGASPAALFRLPPTSTPDEMTMVAETTGSATEELGESIPSGPSGVPTHGTAAIGSPLM